MVNTLNQFNFVKNVQNVCMFEIKVFSLQKKDDYDALPATLNAK